MIFFSGVVVGAGGVDFVFEIAEVDSFSVANDCGAPEEFLLVEANAFVSRAWVSLLRVPSVLSDGCEAKVGSAVVEAVSVYVVNYVSIGGLDELAVH